MDDAAPRLTEPTEPTGPAGAGGPGEDDELLTLLREFNNTVHARIDALQATVSDLLELHEHVDALEAALTDLGALVETAATSAKKPPAAADADPPRAWTARATAQQWHDLADWVDWMMTAYLPTRVGESLPACWPRHVGVVEELAGVHAAWKDAMSKDDEAQSVGDAAAYWHDRYWWSCLDRVRVRLLERCANGGHQEPATPVLTARDGLPTADLSDSTTVS